MREERILVVLLALAGCAGGGERAVGGGGEVRAYVGARLIDGNGGSPIEDGVLIVQDGWIVGVGEAGIVVIPEGAERVDLTGRTIVPGLINTHGHVGGVRGLVSGPEQYTRENVLSQLGLYARYGVTTVVSQGDDRAEGVRIRDEQDMPGLDRARLYVAGPVLTPGTPEEAVAQVAAAKSAGFDWIKIRVDDGLGQREKMSSDVYDAVIAEAGRQGLPMSGHMVYLEDAKGLVRSGATLLAHSVRDLPVDEELIDLMRERGVCLNPTLTREVSTFVYRTRPAFFDDPFFLREVDPEVVAQLEEPARQRQMGTGSAAEYFERALPLAQSNMKRLADSGVRIAFGTDTGPPGRFQGYFEHMELELMAEGGLTPMQILVTATGDAARCMGLERNLGTLETGKWADFVVLGANPLEDIRNMRRIEGVWVAGNRVPSSAW